VEQKKKGIDRRKKERNRTASLSDSFLTKPFSAREPSQRKGDLFKREYGIIHQSEEGGKNHSLGFRRPISILFLFEGEKEIIGRSHSKEQGKGIPVISKIEREGRPLYGRRSFLSPYLGEDFHTEKKHIRKKRIPNKEKTLK